MEDSFHKRNFMGEQRWNAIQVSPGISKLRIVFQILRDKKLYVKLSKCECWLNQGVFFRHVISRDGNTVDPSKIEALVNWGMFWIFEDKIFVREGDCNTRLS